MSSVVVVAACALLVPSPGCQKDEPTQPVAECEPEGGIKCEGNHLQLCTGGVLMRAGECAGGCQTAGREARCFDKSKSLIAPIGTACQPGMALCAMTPNTLLVCREGRLREAATCPGGCLDRGDGSMIYCLDDTKHIRFAEGIGCTGLGENFQLACGADGRSVLKCADEYYVHHSSRCHACKQRRDGQLACLNKVGDRIDPTADSDATTSPEPPALR